MTWNTENNTSKVVENCQFNIGGCNQYTCEAVKALADAYIAHSKSLSDFAQSVLNQPFKATGVDLGGDYE